MHFKEIFTRKPVQEMVDNDLAKTKSAGLRILRLLSEDGEFSVHEEGRLVFHYLDGRFPVRVKVADYESSSAAYDHLEKVRTSVVDAELSQKLIEQK